MFFFTGCDSRRLQTGIPGSTTLRGLRSSPADGPPGALPLRMQAIVDCGLVRGVEAATTEVPSGGEVEEGKVGREKRRFDLISANVFGLEKMPYEWREC